MRWRFADKALAFAPWRSITILKAGSLEEYSLLERWGERGLAPATLLLETCVQAARWLVEASSDFTLGCEAEEIDAWPAPVGLRPGERFCVALRVEDRDGRRIRFGVRQRVLAPGESLPAPDAAWDESGEEARLTCAFVPLAERCLPVDRLCLWQEMRA